MVIAIVWLAAWPVRADVRAPPTRQPSAAQQAELDRLSAELQQHQATQAYVKAVKTARRLHALQRKASGDDAPVTRQRKQALASLLSSSGDRVEALALYGELLRAAELEHGADSREVLNVLLPISGVLLSATRYDELDAVYQRILAITRKLDGEQSATYRAQLTSYGSIMQLRNEYSSAQRIYEQVMRLAEASAGRADDRSLVGPLQLLGTIYWTTNQPAKAIAAFDRAIAISQNDPDVPVVVKASTMFSVAAQYHYAGRSDLARPLVARMIGLYQAEIARLEQTAPDDYQLPGLLGMLAYLHRQNNDLAGAEQAFRKAIAIGERQSGYSGYELSLAEIKRAQGKHAEALALFEHSKAVMSKRAPSSANAYDPMIADVLRELGELRRAEALLTAHLGRLARTYGKAHPLYSSARLSLAFVHMAAGKVAQAENLLASILEASERELALVLKTGTEADHAVYFERSSRMLDLAINFHMSYAPRRRSAARLALTTLLRRKGRVLDAAAANLAIVRSRLSAADRQLLDQLASARSKLAQLQVAGPQATGEADYARAIATLEEEGQKLELQLGKQSASYRVVSQPITLPAIQRRIPPYARLVEIVSFQPGDPNAPYRVDLGQAPRRYAAFVVGSRTEPVMIDLGPVEAIDQAVDAFREAIMDPADGRAIARGRALYDLTMAKVVPRLGGATSILIAPDGKLNLVPFAALVDERRVFLLEKYTFTYLTSGRDLLRLNVRPRAKGGGVIFADPTFDAADGPASPSTGAPASRGRRSAILASLTWQPLPETGQEADEITKIMRGFRVYRGASATETTLKAVRGPKILHVATHGFFLPDQAVRPLADVAAPPGARAPTPSLENPLLRSGLAFAGANQLRSGPDDGILTALEASGLDLWGTRLVVLSACETGVGKVTNGDGVYGLRRALVIAGAESLVMTLWQVDDAATKELMAGYYRNLAAGRSRSAALRDVQRALAARPTYAHPYYWASFVPAGADAPLE